MRFRPILSKINFFQNDKISRNLEKYIKLEKRSKDPDKSKLAKDNQNSIFAYQNKTQLNNRQSDTSRYSKMEQANLSKTKMFSVDSSTQKEAGEKMDSSYIYHSIIEKLDTIVKELGANKMKLIDALTKIEYFINLIIKEKEINDINSSQNFDSNKNINNPNDNTNYNKYSSHSRRIDGYSASKNSLYKRQICKLQKKIKDMENKFKIEELKYLFYIGEFTSKTQMREQESNLKLIEQMPQEKINKLICFPNYIKFGKSDEINPKSIPMYLKRNSLLKRYTQSFQKSEQSKSGYLYQTKDNESFKRKINNYSISEEMNGQNYQSNFSIDDKKDEKSLELIKSMIQLGRINFKDNFLGRSLISGKKKKNYYISHPKISYIKNLKEGKIASWKIDNKINSLPKELSKLRSGFHKNPLIVFPSFIGETMSKIEKLKQNREFRFLDEKYEPEKKYIK